MNRSNVLRYYFPAILWAIFILMLTSYPKLNAPDTGFSAQDKVAHFGVYFIFAFLSSRLLWQGKKLTRQQAMMRSVIFCCIFGVLDEWHQMLIPGRSAEVADAIANIGGVISAQILFLWYAKLVATKESQRIFSITNGMDTV